MKIAPMVERLDGIGLAQRAGIIEWSKQVATPTRLPAGFVLPVSEVAGDNRNDGGIDQRVQCEFAVMLVLNGAARSGVDEQLDELVGKVCDRLVGWRHPEAASPFHYAGGRLASADVSTVVWEVRVRAAYHLRRTS